jgi:hypothetical protein
MNPQIEDLIEKIKALEDELEVEFYKKREEYGIIIEQKRVRFAEEVARQQRHFKTHFIPYNVTTRPLNIMTAPLIYSGFAFFALLDLFLTLHR